LNEAENLKNEICTVVRHLFERKLIFSLEGNISARLPGSNTIWITPSMYKGQIRPENLVKMSLEGEILEAAEDVKPSIEHPMHRAIYKKRSDVNAIVHTHSPAITGLMLAGVELQPLTVEAALIIDKVRLVPFAMPGSQTLAELVSEKVEGGVSALLLQHHGIIGLGGSLWEAVSVVEAIEGIALTQLIATLLAKRPPTIPEEALKALKAGKVIE